MDYENLPEKQMLKRTANTFKCESCDQIIGIQADKNGNEKPESVTDYYRIKISKQGRTAFLFVCPSCA